MDVLNFRLICKEKKTKMSNIVIKINGINFPQNDIYFALSLCFGQCRDIDLLHVLYHAITPFTHYLLAATMACPSILHNQGHCKQFYVALTASLDNR